MLPLHFLLIFLLVLFEFSKFKVVHCNEVHVNHYATCFNLLVHKRSLYTYRNCFGLQTFDWDKYQSKLWAMCLMLQVSTCMKYIYFDWSDLFAKKISWVWKTMSINITIRRLFVMNRHVMFFQRLYLWSGWWIHVWLQVPSSFIFNRFGTVPCRMLDSSPNFLRKLELLSREAR